MEFPHLFFYACLWLRFLDVETSPNCRILCSNMQGLAGLRLSMILLCSETFVLDMRHMSEFWIPRFCSPILLCWGRMP